MSNVRNRRLTGWLFAIGSALFLLFELYLLPQATATLNQYGGAGPLDLLFGYGPQKVNEIFTALGADGRQAYRTVELSLDLLFPLSYTLWFASWMALAYGSSRSYRWLRWTAFAPIVFDLAENAGIVGMLAAYPEPSALLVRYASVCTTLKWCGFAFVMLVLLGGSIAAGIRRLQRRGQTNKAA
ncbi:hypothetical protein B5M42_001890 [Paenibacillus athensensis]|uniref:Uncharacterized protein n=1 Tax=Paenibacillus athensensis TaxID=1967502 RepID=A0A4Y8QAG4_9BACL|nr:hypothetical protein [Paenibacillus athensensis]MCD1257588.1 hypothetical protein [Paenibacillus athensensis]